MSQRCQSPTLEHPVPAELVKLECDEPPCIAALRLRDQPQEKEFLADLEPDAMPASFAEGRAPSRWTPPVV